MTIYGKIIRAMQEQPAPTSMCNKFSDSLQAEAHATATLAKRPKIQAAIMARVDIGFQRYGTYLARNNGRSMLSDAAQEAVDLCIYAEGLPEAMPRHIRRKLHDVTDYFLGKIDEVES